MSIKFTKEEYQKKLSSAPSGVLDIVLGIRENPFILDLVKKYSLDEDLANSITHEITLVILGFSYIDDLPGNLMEILNIDEDGVKSVYKGIVDNIFIKIKDFVDARQKRLYEETREKEQLGLIDKTNNLDHKNILSEIENPTPSIKVAPTLQEAIGVVPELGGFKPTTTPVNPASAIADKLDQKLQGPTAELPKEIYHVKKPDPYHEPIE